MVRVLPLSLSDAQDGNQSSQGSGGRWPNRFDVVLASVILTLNLNARPLLLLHLPFPCLHLLSQLLHLHLHHLLLPLHLVLSLPLPLARPLHRNSPLLPQLSGKPGNRVLPLTMRVMMTWVDTVKSTTLQVSLPLVTLVPTGKPLLGLIVSTGKLPHARRSSPSQAMGLGSWLNCLLEHLGHPSWPALSRTQLA